MPCNNRAKKGLIGAIFMLVPANLIIWKHVTMSRFHKNSGALALFKPCQGRRYFEAERLIRRFAISCAKGMPRASHGFTVATRFPIGIIYIYTHVYGSRIGLRIPCLAAKHVFGQESASCHSGCAVSQHDLPIAADDVADHRHRCVHACVWRFPALPPTTVELERNFSLGLDTTKWRKPQKPLDFGLALGLKHKDQGFRTVQHVFLTHVLSRCVELFQTNKALFRFETWEVEQAEHCHRIFPWPPTTCFRNWGCLPLHFF